MELKKLDFSLTVEDTPANTLERDDGWKGFRMQGKLNFSMIGFDRTLKALALAGYDIV